MPKNNNKTSSDPIPNSSATSPDVNMISGVSSTQNKSGDINVQSEQFEIDWENYEPPKVGRLEIESGKNSYPNLGEIISHFNAQKEREEKRAQEYKKKQVSLSFKQRKGRKRKNDQVDNNDKKTKKAKYQHKPTDRKTAAVKNKATSNTKKPKKLIIKKVKKKRNNTRIKCSMVAVFLLLKTEATSKEAMKDIVLEVFEARDKAKIGFRKFLESKGCFKEFEQWLRRFQEQELTLETHRDIENLFRKKRSRDEKVKVNLAYDEIFERGYQNFQSLKSHFPTIPQVSKKTLANSPSRFFTNSNRRKLVVQDNVLVPSLNTPKP